jgi:hypothetical protein
MARFEGAKRLDSSLPIDPLAEARKLAAPGLFTTAARLAAQGQIAESLVVCERARSFDRSLRIPTDTANTICRSASLRGQPATVLEICDEAVHSDPEDGRLRSSRGIAESMTRRFDDAIADFEAFLAWETREQGKRLGLTQRDWLRAQRAQHVRWISELRAGRDPFTTAELRSILESEASEP